MLRCMLSKSFERSFALSLEQCEQIIHASFLRTGLSPFYCLLLPYPYGTIMLYRVSVRDEKLSFLLLFPTMSRYSIHLMGTISQKNADEVILYAKAGLPLLDRFALVSLLVTTPLITLVFRSVPFLAVMFLLGMAAAYLHFIETCHVQNRVVD